MTTLSMRHQIADLLKQKRIEAKLTPEEAARILELPEELLVKYENRVSEIALNHIFAAANVYNIDPSTIMGILSEIDLNPISTTVDFERMLKTKI